MEDNRIDAIVTLCMLKLRFQEKIQLSMKNIQVKAMELTEEVLDMQSIIDSIQRLTIKGHVKGLDGNFLLGSGIVYHYIEKLQYDDGVSINETLEILENRIRRYSENKRFDL